MKRLLPLFVIVLALLLPLIIFLNIRIQKKINQLAPVSYPSRAIPVSAEDMVREARGEGIEKPESKKIVEKPILKVVRGFYKEFSNSQLSVNTGASVLTTVVTPDLFTVCTPQYWNDNTGNRYDITKAWVDFSGVNLENYTNLGPNERAVRFLDLQPTFTSKTHLIILGQELTSDAIFVTKKVIIVGC